jgi:SMC interacting uncharacterized protein involved in chromosome segregation
MDGLSALSVAASVVQFIEFSSSLVTKSKEIYTSAHGAPIQQVEMEAAIKRLVELSEKIKTAPPRNRESIAQDQALTSICQGCITVSNQLLGKLKKLKVEDGVKHRGYKSFRQALKSVWAKASIDEMAARLNAFRREMDAHVLVSLRWVDI